jgi:hypothetical protein
MLAHVSFVVVGPPSTPILFKAHPKLEPVFRAPFYDANFKLPDNIMGLVGVCAGGSRRTCELLALITPTLNRKERSEMIVIGGFFGIDVLAESVLLKMRKECSGRDDDIELNDAYFSLLRLELKDRVEDIKQLTRCNGKVGMVSRKLLVAKELWRQKARLLGEAIHLLGYRDERREFIESMRGDNLFFGIKALLRRMGHAGVDKRREEQLLGEVIIRLWACAVNAKCKRHIVQLSPTYYPKDTRVRKLLIAYHRWITELPMSGTENSP